MRIRRRILRPVKPWLRILSALIDQIKGMCTSLMSLFGSIIDQSQEYYSFNDGPLITL